MLRTLLQEALLPEASVQSLQEIVLL
ncbi:hypothetical protein DSM3645_05909 [Blastopirellula marina DSM 3645]|uniref:Uncharacterized protein n=1 Tax=Blastopirellula marina DSM 3645 TaxID=314230 RepID=A4A031_9BACT|nr:hypothetical protein DSM3645_05909 [Blastopirellula marina DSM 3645]